MSSENKIMSTNSSNTLEKVNENLPYDETLINNDDTWAVIKHFFNNYDLMRHLTTSYDYFIQFTIPRLFQEFKINTIYHPDVNIDKKYVVELYNYVIDRPQVSPYQCLHSNDTYWSRIFIDIKTTPPLGDPIINKNVYIGNIPVVVFSKLCMLYEYKNDKAKLAELNEDIYDTGGYFIICAKDQAHKRIIVPQERSTPNKISIYTNKKASSTRKITTEVKKTAVVYEIYAEIRSTSPNGFRTTTCLVGYISNIITVLLPWYKEDIPIGIIFRALGVEKDEEIIEYILGKDWKISHSYKISLIQRSLEYSYEIYTQEDCIEYIGSRRDPKPNTAHLSNKEYAKYILENDLFCHLYLSTQFDTTREITQIHFLGIMINELINALYIRDILKETNELKYCTDRDHYSSKRIMDLNILLGQQFYSCLQKIRNDLEDECTSALSKGTGANILNTIKPSIITKSMIGALANNKWSRTTANGVSQLLEEFNYVCGLQFKCKQTPPIVAEGSNTVEPRDLHPSHYLKTCPSETPEGEKAGLLKNKSLASLITFDSDPLIIFNILKMSNLITYLRIKEKGYCNIFINSDLVCSTNSPQALISFIKNIRRSGGMSPEVSITYFIHKSEIRILCDYGRLCYPAMIVENRKLKITKDIILSLVKREIDWNYLSSNGYVELIDTDEEENILLADFPENILKKNYTHCELHPSLAYGIGASTVPFLDHDQSPRVSYQAAMGRQAIGIPVLNYRQLMTGGKVYVLQTVQQALAASRVSTILKMDEMPCSQNATIFIMPRPYNEEDSIELSESAVQRGFMCVDIYENFYAELRGAEKFAKPKKMSTGLSNKKNFSKLCDETIIEENGISKKICGGYVKVGEKVEKGDVLICKVVIDEKEDKEYLHITEYTGVSSGRVDRVEMGLSADGKKYIRMNIVQFREPMVGDKFSARHGQKGTIGMIWKHEDLPFNMRTGETPDVILNSLAFPSRMTIAMFIEMILGTRVCSKLLDGLTVDDVKKVYANINVSNTFLNSDAPVDATAFKKIDKSMEEDIKIELKRYGIFNLGDEYICDGITGKVYKSLIFVGQCCYQRLKHMAQPKMHARARGGRNMISRQPDEGKKRGGGLKIGVQERDVLLAHGASGTLNNSMLDLSDKYFMWVCKLCGLSAIVNETLKTRECRVCLVSGDNIVKIKIPYGTKSVMQQFSGMNMFSRYIPENK